MSNLKKNAVMMYRLLTELKYVTKQTMSSTQAQMLLALAAVHPDSVRQAELSKLLDMRPSNVSNSVNELQKLGLITKSVDPTNVSAVRVGASSKLINILNRVEDRVDRSFEKEPIVDLDFLSFKYAFKVDLTGLTPEQIEQAQEYIEQLKQQKGQDFKETWEGNKQRIKEVVSEENNNGVSNE